MKKVMVCTLAMAGLLQCRGGETVRITGSDTMIQLTQELASEYNRLHPDVKISVSGGGSENGIAQMLNGSVDIAAASRQIMKEEKDKFTQRGKVIRETVAAADGIAVFVNSRNMVSSLTLEQLRGIYTGKIRNWSELGGKKEAIEVISRENTSGTRYFFSKMILQKGDEFPTSVTMAVSSEQIVDLVSVKSSAIGYTGLGWQDNRVKILRIMKDGKPSLPERESILEHRYPLSRNLYYYSAADKPAVADFLEYVGSEAGRKVTEKHGFFAIRARTDK